MKHKMYYWITIKSDIDGILELDPSEYLDCEDEIDIRDKIWDKIWDCNISGDIEDYYYKIPDSFLEEWYKLKEL